MGRGRGAFIRSTMRDRATAMAAVGEGKWELDVVLEEGLADCSNLDIQLIDTRTSGGCIRQSRSSSLSSLQFFLNFIFLLLPRHAQLISSAGITTPPVIQRRGE